MAKFYIIDGNGYIHRAYHALPPLTTSKGEMVNAVYGLIRMLMKLQRHDKPDYIAVCFDHPSPTFRHKQFEQYKAHRKEIDDELKSQMPLAREAARALNIKTFEMPGYEADDLIATLARQAEKDGIKVVIVTGDKDALQLVNDNISVLNEQKGILFDAGKVFDKYGLKPEQLADMFALMGDSSDNVPGIKGIGEKTAVKLIQTFGDIENLIRNADSLQGKTRELVAHGADEARKSKSLVILDEKVPLTDGWKSCATAEPDKDTLQDFLARMEFNSMLREILPAKNEKTVPPEAEAAPAPARGVKVNSEVVDSSSGAMDRFRKELSSADSASFFFVTENNDPQDELIGISATFDGTNAYYLPVSGSGLNLGNQLDEKVILDALKPFLEDFKKKISVYDLKSALRILSSRGIKLARTGFDVMLAAYCLNPSKNSYSLKDIALERLRLEIGDFDELAGTGKKRLLFKDIGPASSAAAACESAAAVHALAAVLKSDMESKDVSKLFDQMEIPLASVLAGMEDTGLKIDMPYFRMLSQRFEGELKDIERQIYGLAGQEFNPASPKQLSFILFEKLKLPAMKKTKTGYSTDEEVLKSLAASHELPAKLLEYREITKLKSTYVDPLLEKAENATSRIHTSFNQTGTATGRLSSSNPNLQNIPVRSEYGREIRRGFIPEKGFTFLSADYSQIDLRVLAHISGDKILTKAFRENFDVHTATAMEVFGKQMSEVTEELRRMAKTINFGIIYGMSPFGLAQQLGISNAEAKRYIDTYFARYSGVKEWTEQVIRDARRNGYVKTLFGRTRYVPEITSSNNQIKGFAERVAMNTPIQGTSADIIKIAMINVYERLSDEKLKSRILVQVHDDLLLELEDGEAQKLPGMIKYDMETAVKLDVPVIVDMKTGVNWADMSKLAPEKAEL